LTVCRCSAPCAQFTDITTGTERTEASRLREPQPGVCVDGTIESAHLGAAIESRRTLRSVVATAIANPALAG